MSTTFTPFVAVPLLIIHALTDNSIVCIAEVYPTPLSGAHPSTGVMVKA